MLFGELQNECLAGWNRFRETQRGQIRSLLNRRYTEVWNAADWDFKFGTASFTPTVGTAQQSLAGLVFNDVYALYPNDTTGNELTRLSPEDFISTYGRTDTGAQRGIPSSYTIYNPTGGQRALFVGPRPDTSPGDLRVYYERPVGYDSGSGVFAAGLMTSDAHAPWWDASYHYLLVFGAIASAMKMVSDNNWPAIEDEFAAALDDMREALVNTTPNRQLQRELEPA